MKRKDKRYIRCKPPQQREVCDVLFVYSIELLTQKTEDNDKRTDRLDGAATSVGCYFLSFFSLYSLYDGFL